MQASRMAPHFSPHRDGFRPCWHCRHFVGLVYAGTAALCGRPGATPIAAAPASGCAFWSREPGADDEPSPPSALPASAQAAIIRRVCNAIR
jgi:hypothetical protein